MTNFLLPINAELHINATSSIMRDSICLFILFLGIGINWWLPEKKRKNFQLLCGVLILFFICGFAYASTLIAFILTSYYFFHGKYNKYSRYFPILVLPVFAVLNFPHISFLIISVQWLKLYAYLIDLNDELISAKNSQREFLLYFFLPPFLPSLLSGVFLTIFPSQLNGTYQKTPHISFLKNGIYLILLSFIYKNFIPILSLFSIEFNAPTIRSLLIAVSQNRIISPQTLWYSVIMEQINFFLLFAAILHFRIGLLNLFGYQLVANFNKPWLSIGFADLWIRISFYYRNFLLRAIFSRVIFFFKKTPENLRVFYTILLTAGMGNFFIHLYYDLLRENRIETLKISFKSWPYFLLLSILISLTFFGSSFRTKKREHWKFNNNIFLDIFWAVLTVSIFCLIHVFARHSEHTTISHSLHLLKIAFFL